jgi:hypothetical protein
LNSMKKTSLLTALMALALPALGQNFNKSPFLGYPTESWCDFEFTASAGAVTPTLLNGSTHGLAVTWAVRDASSELSTSTSGEKAASPSSPVDTGTRGLAVSTVGNIQASVGATFTATDIASAGVWMFAPATSADTGIDCLQFVDASSNTRALASFRKISGAYSMRFSASASASTVTVTPGNWYWVALTFAKSGTCSMMVFDSTGAQVGTTQTGTDTGGVQVTNVRVGPDNSYGAITAVTAYYDDLIIRTSASPSSATVAPIPLGP